MIPTKQPNGTDKKRTKGAIRGPRPSPLKIHQNSRPIHKQSSSSSSSSNSLQKQNRKKPIIVYARSPKIIHTKAHDFMALVQKLTGLSRDHALQDSSNYEGRPQTQDENSRRANSCEGIAHIDENKDGHVNATTTWSLYSPLFRMPINPYLADIPLFTPNSADFFCSPRPLFRSSDMMSLSPNIGNLLSPSFMEAMKGLPEY